MPSKSEKQRRFIFARRSQLLKKYKTKSKVPEKDQWVFKKEWETVKKTNESQQHLSTYNFLLSSHKKILGSE